MTLSELVKRAGIKLALLSRTTNGEAIAKAMKKRPAKSQEKITCDSCPASPVKRTDPAASPCDHTGAVVFVYFVELTDHTALLSRRSNIGVGFCSIA
jgi:hypothetical protein